MTCLKHAFAAVRQKMAKAKARGTSANGSGAGNVEDGKGWSKGSKSRDGKDGTPEDGTPADALLNDLASAEEARKATEAEWRDWYVSRGRKF